MSHPHDPLAPIIDAGIRVVWMEDFDYQVYLVEGVDVVLIDRLVSRRDAAECLIEMLAHPWQDLGRPGAS